MKLDNEKDDWATNANDSIKPDKSYKFTYNAPNNNFQGYLIFQHFSMSTVLEDCLTNNYEITEIWTDITPFDVGIIEERTYKLRISFKYRNKS